MAKHLRRLLGALLGLGLGCAHAAQVPPPGSSGSLIWNSSGNWAGGTLSGDCSNSSLTLTCTKVNGVTVSLGGALTTTAGDTLTFNLSGNTTVTLPTTGTLLTTAGSGAGLTGITWSQIGSTPTTLAGYGITSPLAIAQGGTAASSASGTALDNITGFSSTGLIDRTGAGAYSFTAPGAGVLTALGNATNASGGVVTSPVANVNLANSSTTVNSQSCALGGTCTVTVSIGSGVTGLGAGVATALSDAVGASGAFLVGGTSNTGGGITLVTSTNTGATNLIETGNAGTVSNAATVAGLEGILTSGTNAYVYMNMVGGASPQGVISTGTGATGGLLISGGGGPLSLAAPVLSGTVTGTYTLGGTPSIAATALTSTLQAAQFPALTGDITTTAGALATTLATVNSNTGAFGSATNCPTITLNGKGLATAASATTCTPAIGSVTGLGANVATALGVAVGSAGAVVTNGGALGTPSSGTATNLTGTAAGLTAGIANAIASATTTVNTSAATAPTLGKVLTATSGTTATWQTPAGGGGAPLSLLYNAWASVGSQIVRIANLGDSILTCNQQAPCTYGPQRIGSTFALFLIDELSQRFPQYSTGYRAIERLTNGSTTVSAGDGYTLTSGTATNSTLLGPQESGVALNGGSLFTFSSGAVLTIAVGQPYASVNIACVQGTGISGYTVTINGSSVGTACGSGSGSATATIQNFANPVAFASQPTTGSTLTLTALGATNYLYAYEGVLFCGASNVACTSGFAVDNWGVGGASSPWFASGTKAGSTDGGMVWVKAASGQLAMCVLENGENDANSGSGVTSTQQNAQNQIVATDCQTKNASVFFFVPPPFNSGGSPATYAALQQGSLTYCLAQGWACLNMADIFMGDQSGTLSSTFPFSAQDTGMGLTPPWGTAQGLITNSDNQHLTDCGELLITQQFMSIVFGVNYPYPLTQACSQNPQKSAISSAYTNATTGFTIIQGATANTGQLEFVAPVNEAFTSSCSGYMTVGTTGAVSFELVGSAAISNINITLQYQTAANSVYTFTSATALASALATSSITAASNLQWVMTINGVNSSAANSFAVEAHEASGTLTVPAGASCLTQMNGPQ